jgi:hypothetical protein
VDNTRSGPLKTKSVCKSCSAEKVNQWKERNRDEYNAYQQAYRAKRKTEGNPVTRRA